MASIRKRGNKWQVQVRSRKAGSLGKSFHRKADAQKWALEQETLIQTSQFKKTNIQNLTLKDLMAAYARRVTPSKRGAAQESCRLKRLLREDTIMRCPLPDAEPPIFAQFRDKRLKDGVRACQYDLALIRHAWNIARIEWGWSLKDNPIAFIRIPKSNPPRERRLRPGEYEALRHAGRKTRSWYLWPVIDIAIETAMRRSEILNIEWKHIDWKNKRVLIPLAKNGRSRWVPLSEVALAHFNQAPRTSDHIFPITAVALRQSWERLRKRAHIEDLTFHDLRHEGISRLFESGLSIPQVMMISGHRTASQLFRYIQVI